MTRHLTPLLWVLLILFFVLLGLIGNSRSSEISHSGPPNFDDAGFNSIDQAASGSILPISSKLETRLIALPDGRILLMHQDNEKVIWSFSSGPLIYSLYRAPFDQDNERKYPSTRNGFDYVDYRENGKLYAHTKQDTILELPAIEQFISSTPMILEDGEIVLGSKKTTVFLIDAKNGRLIRTYGSSDSPSMMQTKEEESVLYDRNKLVESSSVERKDIELPLYITRTDYTLKSFAANSSKVLWKLAVAEFGAAYLCPNMENAFEEASTNSGNESGSPFGMPLPCQSKVVVYPIRNNDKLKSMLTLGVLPQTLEFALTQLIPSQPAVDKYLDYDHDNIMLPVPASRDMLPSEPPFDRILDFQSNRNEIALHPSSSKNRNWGKSYLQNVRIYGVIIALCGFLFVYFIRRYAVVDEKQVELDGQHNDSNVKTQSSKRKKVRKSGKNNGSVEKKDRPLSSGNENGFAHIQSDNTPWSNLNKLIGGAEGRRIGKLFVSNREIAKGSNGTVVLEGIYEGRPVAVKRLVQAHHDVAFKEIQNLIVSDRHPNIVRWYGVEYDQDFVYLSLERCTCSLDDLIQIWSTSSEHSVVTQEQASSSMTEYKVQLDSVKAVIGDANLWTENGYASPMLLKLMRDVVAGLVHLHELGIIHRDLKPQNVLISKERSLCAKLSDMGISKRLLENMSSLDHHPTGCGSSGWQAPEQLLHGRQTRAVDLFSLGCVLFFCITGGKHPFGDRLERDYNIVKNQVDLFLVECIPEAVDLFSQLLNPDPELRPKALEVLNHPLFWDSEMRLSFLRDASDRVELEDRETKSDILHAVEGIASMALGTKWDEKMEPEFIANIGHYRRYKYDSVRDLLRVMRNKLNHYRELPKEIQDHLGPVPEGFDRYFASRFPKLLTEVYKVVRKLCREEECFQKYFKVV